MPDWNGWITLRSVGIPTTEFSAVQINNIEKDGNAGSSEGGFDNQSLLADVDRSLNLSIIPHESTRNFGVGSLGSRLSYGAFIADQIGGNSNTSLSADGHAVQSQNDSGLLQGQDAALGHIVVNEHAASHPEIGDGGATVDLNAIGITDVDIGVDFSSKDSQRAIANPGVFDLKELPLETLPPLPLFGRETNGFIERASFVDAAPSLSQGEDQQNQNALQHNLSFGSLTLPLASEAVKQREEMLRRLSGVQFEVADLPGTYLALTRFERNQSGTIISSRVTIDQDAAGYGWFIDSTPGDSSEFGEQLNGWAERAATDRPAAGKIDLLTAIYHELGHVMGLDHVSSDIRAYDVMNPILQVGVRSLPSAFDLSLFSNDVTYWDGLHVGSGFSGGSSSSGGGSGSGGGAVIIPPQFLANNLPPATHVDVLNGTFANENLSDPQFAWDLRGGVSVEHGAAVLHEDASLNSRLSQAFFLPANVQSLHFTLSNLDLRTESGVPPDAFEVALLDSATLAPLTGVVDGLTLTDSLLNIQAGGTTYKNAGVTLTSIGTSGTSYLVDVNLTGVTVGTGARLYFDLLGFGQRTSSVTIDNVLLTNGQPTAAPVAVNDSYTVAEGTTLDVPTLGLLTNDLDPDTSAFSLTAFSLTAPTHGTLTVNADGSFTYVHNGSETLTDSFTYRVSDGINLSNIATVTLTVTPVNDAPVVASIALQTVEQRKTLTFTVSATDPDLPLQPLAFSLAAGAPTGAAIDPVSGVFTWAVPITQTIGSYTITVRATDNGTPVLFGERTVTVVVEQARNVAPVLAPIGAKSINEQSELRFTISATDADLPAQTLT